MNKIKLGEIELTENSSPYLIAEIGVNHEGSLKKAFEMIDDAKNAGVNAVKFQTYKSNKIASKNSPAYWDTSKESTKSQYELFSKYDVFEKEDYIKLHKYCNKVGIEFLSTPFDLDSIDFLDELLNFYKISSSDITNYPLLRKVASKKKPIILSTGASTIEEIKKAKKELYKNGCKELILMHCILNYPTLNKNANLNTIKLLKEEFSDCIIGYSDHTLPDNHLQSLVYAYLLGAVVIEKHFTFDKTLKGNDHYHSMDKIDVQDFYKTLDILKTLMGKREKNYVFDIEEKSRKNARRSLFYANNLEKGETLKSIDLISLRPNIGICPSSIDEFIGRKLIKDVKKDDLLDINDFK